MFKVSKFNTLALAAACLLATSSVHPAKEEALPLPIGKIAVLGGLIGCTYLLLMREKDKNFTPRYSAAKLKDVKNICTKEYANNLWYFFYDGFIGQSGKSRKEAHGILGTTAYYLMPIKKAGSTVAFAYTLWRTKLDYEKHIKNLAKHKN